MAALWVWPAGIVSYLILAGSLDADEIGVAIALGAVGAGWHAAVCAAGGRRFAFEAAALGAVARSFAGLPGATWRVGARLAAALLSGAAGRRIEIPFVEGARSDPREAGRRAVAVLATSLAPDSYVLRLPATVATMECHALTGHVPGGDPRWPA